MTTSTTLTVTERIKAGSAWLDEHAPGWEGRVDLDRLDMSSCLRCVLAHVFGTYGMAPLGPAGDPFGWNDQVAVDLGFEAISQLGDVDVTASDYRELLPAWRETILARRAGGAS